MAIQKNITDKFGVTHENAYIKINHIEISDPSIINVLVYTNVAARSKGNLASEKQPVLSIGYTLYEVDDIETVLGDSVLKVNEKSPLVSVYTWLKTLDDTISNKYSSEPSGSGIDWTTGTTDV